MNNAAARFATEAPVSDQARRSRPFVGLYGATSMAKKSYWEKLKDPRWQRKRLEKMQERNFACEACFDTTTTLNVHHKIYIKGRDPWEYDLDQLALLCEVCHQSEHEDDALMDAISRLEYEGPGNRNIIAALVYGTQGIPKKFRDLHGCAAYLIGRRFNEEFYRLLACVNKPETKEHKAMYALLDETEEE